MCVIRERRKLEPAARSSMVWKVVAHYVDCDGEPKIVPAQFERLQDALDYVRRVPSFLELRSTEITRL